ncbi:MAG: AMP-binding protein [Thermoplasmatales archaeon]|nr:AMP-binding protein [Thermoplasmatales archaeon]MCW6171125.1 AMP-binding protein [Thermoplasmatales archaeon]
MEIHSNFVYTPRDPQNTKIMAFARKNGISDLRTLYDRADDDPEWFWRAVIDDVGISFKSPFTKLKDDSKGIPYTKWFVGGKVNIAYNCVEKFKESDTTAIKFESEEGEKRYISFQELDLVTGKLAGSLRDLGVKKGDRVGIYMPSNSDGVISFYSILRLGAVAVPVFSGYGIEAVQSRMKDAGAKFLFSQERYNRKGKQISTKSLLEELSDVELILSNGKLNGSLDFHRLISDGNYLSSVATDSEDPAIMLYTSGTTGKPKGTVHVHGGTLVNVAKEVKYYMDIGPNDSLFWVSDLGWMMGPWSIIGANVNGGSIFEYDGAVDYPDSHRLWNLLKNNNVTLLGLSPTLVRALRAKKTSGRLPNVRVFGSTGEPWDEESWMYLFNELGGGEVPIANISGGTDIIGCFLASTPAISLKPKCLYRGLGMNVSVYDENGKDVYDTVGNLVSKAHCPSMTRGIWHQDEKYIETYWSMFKNVWVQGDWAYMDRDGYFYLYGRSDDVIKVAGKRVGPNELEDIVMTVNGVTEAAVISIPDEVKGEAICVFFTGTNDDGVISAISKKIENDMGKSFLPRFVIWLPALPKTKNGKIMRRLVKRAFMGMDYQDTTNLDDLSIVDYIREIGVIYLP